MTISDVFWRGLEILAILFFTAGIFGGISYTLSKYQDTPSSNDDFARITCLKNQTAHAVQLDGLCGGHKCWVAACLAND